MSIITSTIIAAIVALGSFEAPTGVSERMEGPAVAGNANAGAEAMGDIHSCYDACDECYANDVLICPDYDSVNEQFQCVKDAQQTLNSCVAACQMDYGWEDPLNEDPWGEDPF